MFFGGRGGGGAQHKVKPMPIGTYNIVLRDTMNGVCVGESNIGGGHMPPVCPPSLVPTPMLPASR